MATYVTQPVSFAFEPDAKKIPSPWTVERIPGGYVVKDASGHALAYCYGHPTFADADIAKGLTPDEARRVATHIAKLPDLLKE